MSSYKRNKILFKLCVKRFWSVLKIVIIAKCNEGIGVEGGCAVYFHSAYLWTSILEFLTFIL